MPAEPATELRLLHQGDTWSYVVEGSLTPPGGPAIPLTGTINVKIETAPLPGRPPSEVIAFVQALETIAPDGTRAPFPAPPLMFWYTQDQTTRDVLIYADTMTPDGSPRVAAEGQIFYPGTWSITTAYANRLDFGAGNTVDNTLTIQGVDIVEAPFGTRAAWYGPITSDSPMTGRIDGADWWTPELGAPIRFETKSTMPDGAVMAMRAEMTDTNVA
jgi:hypothetical protein